MDVLSENVLGGEICPKLGLRGQILFSAVCRSWRSMAVENQKFMYPIPWLLISRDEATNTGTFLSLVESKIYQLTLTPSTSHSESFCTSSSQGYLVITTPRTYFTPPNDRIFLYNPFSHTHIHLPRQYISRRDDASHRSKYYFHRVFVSSQFVVSAITGRLFNIIEMCKPGDQEWSVFGDDDQMIQEREESQDYWDFSDILFYKGMLYGLTQTNRLVCFEYKDSKTTPSHKLLIVLRMSSPEDDNFKFTTSYLVESCGELLMVYRFSNKIPAPEGTTRSRPFVTGKFIVFKLNQSTDPFQWVEVQNLGNQMLFLGRNSSLSICAQGIPRMKGNCIYFTEDFWPFYECGPGVNHEFSDNGVYHLHNGRFESIFPAGVGDSPSFTSPSIWITPTITLEHFH